MKNISVYYDGLCHLCSREIGHYRGMRGAESIRFVDITAGDFNALKEGVDPRAIHRVMHVKDVSGDLHTGVDAFLRIWAELPALRFFIPLARFGPVNLLLRAAYAGFARIRPLLPRKSCEASPYCETKS